MTRRVLVLGSFLALSGCGIDVQYIPMNSPPHAMTPRPASQVEMFAGSRPKRPFVEVGAIEVQQEKYNNASAEEIVAALRDQAGERGCDGILLIGANDATDVSGSADRNGGWVSSKTLKGYRATCIVYTQPAVAQAPSPPPCTPDSAPAAPPAPAPSAAPAQAATTP